MQNSNSCSSLPSMREVTVVEIKDPITHQKKTGRKYTDFEICLKSNSKAFTIGRSSVRRRYSDFVWLRNWLSENNEGFSSIRKTPSLPPKKLIGRFEDEFLQDRMKGLQRFLRKVIEHNVFLSDKALHLFLQSNLSIKQIENYLTGKPFDDNDCKTTRKIMDGNGHVGDSEQEEHLQAGFARASSESISSLQRITEASENCSSLEFSSVHSVTSIKSLSDTDKAERMSRRDSQNGKEEHMYESFASLSKSSNGDSGKSEERSISPSKRSIKKSRKRDSKRDKKYLKQTNGQNAPATAENRDIASQDELNSKLFPIFKNSSNCNDSSSPDTAFSNSVSRECLSDSGSINYEEDVGDTNSSFSLIGSASLTCSPSAESLSVGSSPDLSDRRLIAAVPIIHSDST